MDGGAGNHGDPAPARSSHGDLPPSPSSKAEPSTAWIVFRTAWGGRSVRATTTFNDTRSLHLLTQRLLASWRLVSDGG